MKREVQTKMLEIGTTGIQNKVTLLTPGNSSAGDNYIDRNSKIHIRDVDLVVGGAATITLYMSHTDGDKAIYERTLTAAGEIHSFDRDLFVPDNKIRSLKMSVSGNTTVVGKLFYTVELTGGASKNSGTY
jgi:hypothetical protein